MKRLLFTLTLLCAIQNSLISQVIQPGFDSKELQNMLILSSYQIEESGWAKFKDLPEMPANFELAYRSEVVGLDNRWDLFTNEKTAVISIRGSVGTMKSWVGNFYAAMIPAVGEISLNDSTNFKYKLAESQNAYVHIGWTIGLGALAPDIISKINDFYEKGYKDFYIVGFSQGASIAQLLTSYVRYLPEGTIPKDIQFKTYAIACPKTGNMEYANDYTYLNRGGWEYRVVNMKDWVTRVPFTVQRTSDMPTINPFADIDAILKTLKPIQKTYISGIYNKLNAKLDNASKQLEKVFGNKISMLLTKNNEGMESEDFIESFDYYPAGTNIVLSSGKLPEGLSAEKSLFFHHRHLSYLERIKLDYTN